MISPFHPRAERHLGPDVARLDNCPIGTLYDFPLSLSLNRPHLCERGIEVATRPLLLGGHGLLPGPERLALPLPAHPRPHMAECAVSGLRYGLLGCAGGRVLKQRQ